MSADDEIGHEDGLQPGKIRFLDHFIPTLRDGEYMIKARHTLSGGTIADSAEPDSTHFIADSEDGEKEFVASQMFTVRGPRFDLPSQDVHLVSPPANHAGRFSSVLPSIVLNKRGLPWERRLKVDEQHDDAPWMALLVLRPDEILTPPEVDDLKNRVRTAQFPLAQVLSGGDIQPGPAAGVVGPDLSLHNLTEDEKNEAQSAPNASISCKTIDISPATFAKLVPRLDEARFLTHVRQVHTGDKEVLGHKDDGWFSVAVSKRFPTHDDTEIKSTPYVAHLVSLEGFEAHLKSQPEFSEATKAVRMISLASWCFNVIADPGESFPDLMMGLIDPLKHGLTDLKLKLPFDPQQASDSVAQRLNSGYTAMSYQTRTGAQTFAWYRGPLAPDTVPGFFKSSAKPNGPPPPDRAVEGYIYDQENGVFDLSYGVAFSTGRSLALADKVFGTSVLNWRRVMHGLVDVLQSREASDFDFSQSVQDLGLADDDYTQIMQALVQDRLMGEVTFDTIVGELAETLTVAGQDPGDILAEQAGYEGLDQTLQAKLKILKERPEVAEALGALQRAHPEDMILWLAKRALLEGVPFTNLVADAKMLPVESIRFFEIDENWLRCMIDGALSVGTQSSRDTVLYQLLRGPLMRSVEQAIHKLRDQLRGQATPPHTNTLEGMCGFLLRSAVVSGWPGLEIKAYQGTGSASTKIKLMRMERLSPDVMLVMFSTRPHRIELNEPREGLRFGYELLPDPNAGEDKKIFICRHINGPQTGASFAINEDDPPLTFPLTVAEGTDDVMDIVQTVQDIKAGVGLGADDTLGAAAFALSLVKVPEQMLFEQPEKS